MNSVYYHFLPYPPIALSVVSMEVFAPHKMVEIRASAWRIREKSMLPLKKSVLLYRTKIVTALAKALPSYKVIISENKPPLIIFDHTLTRPHFPSRRLDFIREEPLYTL